MKKISLMASVVISMSLLCNAQITKKNWMLGGNISYTYKHQKDNYSTVKLNLLDISPSVGYFFADKISTGLKASVKVGTAYSSGAGTTKYNFGYIGPFLRYYFLPTEYLYNLFIEPCYQYYFRNETSSNSNHGHEHGYSYSVLAGPAIFLNSVVAIEFGIKYQHGEISNNGYKENIFQPSLGLQVHLEKEK